MDQANQELKEEKPNQQELDDTTNMLKRPPAPLNLTCGVCSAPAPDHLHFGAHTCYSCRAFFRRTAQRKAAKGLKRCRTGLKNCEVSDQKKNCIHCRYLKCINIGMTTDLMQGQRNKKDFKEESTNDGHISEEDDNMKQVQDELHKENKDRKRPVPIYRANTGKITSNVQQSEQKKTKLFEPVYSQSFASEQQEYKPSSEWLKSSFPIYDSHSTAKQAVTKQAISPTPFFSSGRANFSASGIVHPSSRPYLTCNKSQIPSSTITSQAYQREHEYERKPKILMFEENHFNNVNDIKREPSLLDDVVYEGSMTSSGLYVNPHVNIPRQNPSPPHMARYQDRPTLTEQDRINSRPSVIRNSNTAREQEHKFLQMEAQMLKMHGDLLTQTGNLMNFHANILGQRILQPVPQLEPIPHVNQDHREHVQASVINDHVNLNQIDVIKQEAKKISVIKAKGEDDVPKMKKSKPLMKKNPSIANLDEIILEADSVLENSAWSMAMDKYLDKDLDIDLDLLLGDALLENTVKDDEENLMKNKEVHMKKICDQHPIKRPQYTNEEDLTDTFEYSILPRSSGFVSVIRGPEMVFSREELNFLTRMKIVHTDISRRAMPISLHQACVARYLGKLSMEGMLSIIAAGRKAQNFYHYMTMASQPYFNELTTRTQNLLMKQNTQLCFALNIANYFFGHNANTLIEQESMTGLVSGVEDFILANAPVAINMPPASYDEYFAGPWATDREQEAKHRELTKSIGQSLQELDFSSYLLLYGITLYNISQQAMDEMDINQKDREVIGKAQTYLDLMYKRYTKHLIGWKKASETRWNQRFLLDQMGECVLIFSMKNLHLNDLTDSKTLDVSKAKLQ